eukprot:10968889-Lingulodinium_polyedra.AAC.1
MVLRYTRDFLQTCCSQSGRTSLPELLRGGHRQTNAKQLTTARAAAGLPRLGAARAPRCRARAAPRRRAT